ncbi:MAG: class I SAM-dependent methyltransferase [Ferruginibacter sp.]
MQSGKYYQSAAYVSHSDTKEGLVNRLYHKVRSITLSGKRKLVSSETGLSKGAILDIGCGTGAFLSGMKNAGWVGHRPGARRNRPEQSPRALPAGATFIRRIVPIACCCYMMPLPCGMCWSMCTSWMNTLTGFNRCSKSVAVLFIAVPNLQSYDAAHYKECWAAYDVPRHLYHFSANGMEQLLQRHGLKLKKIKPMWFDSFYVSMLSEQYRNGKGNILKASFIGFLSNLKAMFNQRKCSSLIYIVTK